MPRLISRYAVPLAVLPAAGIASTMCAIALKHAAGFAYFAVFWLGFSAAVEFLRTPSRGPLVDKIAFWLFFPAGVAILIAVFAVNFWR